MTRHTGILGMKGTITLKGVYLDFSRLAELRNVYITVIYIKKKEKIQIIKIFKNHKITKKKKKKWCSLKRLGSLLSYFKILRQKSKKVLWEYQVTNDA